MVSLIFIRLVGCCMAFVGNLEGVTVQGAVLKEVNKSLNQRRAYCCVCQGSKIIGVISNVKGEGWSA